jgi:hypothetical protein
VLELGNDLLSCLTLTADSAERRRDEFSARMNLVRTEVAVRGFTAEAEQIIRDALDQVATAEDDRHRFPGLRCLAYLHMMRSDFARMYEIAGELMEIAEHEQDPLLLSEAHLLSGLGRAWLDDLPSSLEHYAQAVTSYEATQSGQVAFRVGTNPGVVANVVTALTQWMIARPEGASAAMQRALELAAELDHPFSMAYALHHAALLDLWGMDLPGVGSRADALLALADAHDYPTWRALAVVWRGMARVGGGDVDAGLAELDEGFELYQGVSAPPVFWPALLMLRAVALGAAGQGPRAVACIQEADAALQPGDPMGPDVCIVQGDLLRALDPPDLAGAEASFVRAAELAAGHGARMTELQARTRLVELRRGRPDERDAVDALAAVYDELTEGFDTPPLLAARAALGR